MALRARLSCDSEGPWLLSSKAGRAVRALSVMCSTRSALSASLLGLGKGSPLLLRNRILASTSDIREGGKRDGLGMAVSGMAGLLQVADVAPGSHWQAGASEHTSSAGLQPSSGAHEPSAWQTACPSPWNGAWQANCALFAKPESAGTGQLVSMRIWPSISACAGHATGKVALLTTQARTRRPVRSAGR